MTVKQAIPKIEWAIELLYNSVKRQEVSELENRWVYRQDVVEKAITRQKEPLGPPMSLETCWWQDAVEEARTQQSLPLALRLSSSPEERERHTAMSGGAGEVNMLQSLLSLQLPLTHNISNKVRGIFF